MSFRFLVHIPNLGGIPTDIVVMALRQSRGTSNFRIREHRSGATVDNLTLFDEVTELIFDARVHPPHVMACLEDNGFSYEGCLIGETYTITITRWGGI